jgi:hypothetical protein
MYLVGGNSRSALGQWSQYAIALMCFVSLCFGYASDAQASCGDYVSSKDSTLLHVRSSHSELPRNADFPCHGPNCSARMPSRHESAAPISVPVSERSQDSVFFLVDEFGEIEGESGYFILESESGTSLVPQFVFRPPRT